MSPKGLVPPRRLSVPTGASDRHASGPGSPSGRHAILTAFDRARGVRVGSDDSGSSEGSRSSSMSGLGRISVSLRGALRRFSSPWGRPRGGEGDTGEDMAGAHAMLARMGHKGPTGGPSSPLSRSRRMGGSIALALAAAQGGGDGGAGDGHEEEATVQRREGNRLRGEGFVRGPGDGGATPGGDGAGDQGGRSWGGGPWEIGPGMGNGTEGQEGEQGREHEGLESSASVSAVHGMAAPLQSPSLPGNALRQKSRPNHAAASRSQGGLCEGSQGHDAGAGGGDGAARPRARSLPGEGRENGHWGGREEGQWGGREEEQWEGRGERQSSGTTAVSSSSLVGRHEVASLESIELEIAAQRGGEPKVHPLEGDGSDSADEGDRGGRGKGEGEVWGQGDGWQQGGWLGPSHKGPPGKRPSDRGPSSPKGDTRVVNNREWSIQLPGLPQMLGSLPAGGRPAPGVARGGGPFDQDQETRGGEGPVSAMGLGIGGEGGVRPIPMGMAMASEEGGICSTEGRVGMGHRVGSQGRSESQSPALSGGELNVRTGDGGLENTGRESAGRGSAGTAVERSHLAARWAMPSFPSTNNSGTNNPRANDPGGGTGNGGVVAGGVQPVSDDRSGGAEGSDRGVGVGTQGASSPRSSAAQTAVGTESIKPSVARLSRGTDRSSFLRCPLVDASVEMVAVPGRRGGTEQGAEDKHGAGVPDAINPHDRVAVPFQEDAGASARTIVLRAGSVLRKRASQGQSNAAAGHLNVPLIASATGSPTRASGGDSGGGQENAGRADGMTSPKGGRYLANWVANGTHPGMGGQAWQGPRPPLPSSFSSGTFSSDAISLNMYRIRDASLDYPSAYYTEAMGAGRDGDGDAGGQHYGEEHQALAAGKHEHKRGPRPGVFQLVRRGRRSSLEMGEKEEDWGKEGGAAGSRARRMGRLSMDVTRRGGTGGGGTGVSWSVPDVSGDHAARGAEMGVEAPYEMSSAESSTKSWSRRHEWVSSLLHLGGGHGGAGGGSGGAPPRA
eukprot:jgi/Mesvir1/15260/Mv06480-RA.1